MCLILFAHHTHPELPFVVAANRDEFYGRATRPAQFWPEAGELLAGKDLVAGGTWLGIARNGRFAAITNFREGQRPLDNTALSRGLLTRDFLLGTDTAQHYADQLLVKAHQYSGFNLLIKDSETLIYCSNIDSSLTVLPPGYYGLSNHLLNTPWPKVTQGVERLKHNLQNFNGDDHGERQGLSNALLQMLADPTPAADTELPATGIPLDREKLLSSAFIQTPQYGTCCSTSVIQTADNQVLFTEKNYFPHDDAQREFAFTLSG